MRTLGPIFKARRADEDVIAKLVSVLTPIPADDYQYSANDLCHYPWVLPDHWFEQIFINKRDATPGPDGIPYSAWKAS
eukprot:7335852-Pyramimonas_sp.AAC.1